MKRRIKSLDARLDLIDRRLEGLKIGKRKRVQAALERLVKSAVESNAELRELYNKADKDQDGRIDPDEMEELVEILADWLDDHFEPENEWLEKLSDLGIEILAWVALAIYRDTAARLRRRRTRLRRRKRNLEKKVERDAARRAKEKAGGGKKKAGKKKAGKKKAGKKKAGKKKAGKKKAGKKKAGKKKAGKKKAGKKKAG